MSDTVPLTPSLLLTLGAELALLLGLAWSVALPSRRIWPPGSAGWRLGALWICVLVCFAGLLVVAVGDVGGLGLDGIGWRWIGAVTVLAGTTLAYHGVTTIGETATAGLSAELVTTGPYRFTRNPQYLGDILAVVGVAVLSNSPSGATVALPAILCFLLFPLSEEPWLRRQYGRDYEAYCRRVPRFVGLRTFRAVQRRD